MAQQETLSVLQYPIRIVTELVDVFVHSKFHPNCLKELTIVVFGMFLYVARIENVMFYSCSTLNLQSDFILSPSVCTDIFPFPLLSLLIIICIYF